MVIIQHVAENSRAARAGLMSGDVLVAINGNEINDVLDYRFYLADTLITLEFTRNGKKHAVTVKKQGRRVTQ